jgi:hypothetical protein
MEKYTRIINSAEFRAKYGQSMTEELELFFANAGFTPEQKLKVLQFLDRGYDRGYLDGGEESIGESKYIR